MTKHLLLRVFLVLGLLAATACQQGAREDSPDEETGSTGQRDGDPFSLMAMVHSPPQADPRPNAPGPPVPTVKWDGRKEGGPFSYSSVRCIDPAPINDVSTNLTTFNGRIPESFSPASIRLQPVEFRVTKGGDSGRIEGTINLVACGLSSGRFSRVGEDPAAAEAPDDKRDKITFSWGANYKRVGYAGLSPNASEAAWVGEFSIIGGTGRYQGIQGSGHISGSFLCLEGGGCSQPEYTDGQVVMVGTYKAPNIPPAPPG